MSPLTTETIERLKIYEEKMLQRRAIDAELEELKALIEPDMPTDPIETDTGVFKLRAGKTKWTYSENTQAKETELKNLKKREEQDGTAVSETGKPYLEYRERVTGK